ncbi:MAG: hypothetical protein U9N46_07610 [Euryarchaeota archaeon]|nr:hypothetical protein [Euryarchaeota archaeon]
MTESRGYAELIPHTTSRETIKEMNPMAIIISGGPSSGYAENAPGCDPELFNLGIPILGIFLVLPFSVVAIGTFTCVGPRAPLCVSAPLR